MRSNARSLTMMATAFLLLAPDSTPTQAAPELATLTEVGWGNPTIEDLLDPENLTLEFGGSDQGTDSATYTDGFDDGLSSFNGTANASASYGAVGVFATAASVDSTFLVSRAIGQAAFTDTMTITGGTPGELDTVTFTLDVTGTSSTSGDAGLVFIDAFVVRVLDGVEDIDLIIEFDQDSFTYESKEFTFRYDEPFELSIGLGVQASVVLTSSATGDFANTVTLTDAAVSGGAPFSLAAGSGTVYPFGNLVPEPASWILLSAGTLVGISRRRVA